MELAFDIDVDNRGIGTQCVIGGDPAFGGCPIASTSNLVAAYADVG